MSKMVRKETYKLCEFCKGRGEWFNDEVTVICASFLDSKYKKGWNKCHICNGTGKMKEVEYYV